MSGLNINTGLYLGAGFLIGTTGFLKSIGLYYNAYFARFFNLPEKVTETHLIDTTGNDRHFTLTRRNCLIGDGVAKLTFSDLPIYDAMTIVEDGVEVAAELTANELVLADGKTYNYAVFTSLGVDVAKFPLMEHDSDDTVSLLLSCFDVIGNASCICNGDADNVVKANGLSWNFAHGFALMAENPIYYPKKVGTGYGGAPVDAVEFPAYHTAANQYVKATSDDVVFIALDSEEQFYDAGTPANVHLADIYANDYVQVTGAGVVTDLKVLADISNALLTEDGLFALMSEDGQYLLIPER